MEPENFENVPGRHRFCALGEDEGGEMMLLTRMERRSLTGVLIALLVFWILAVCAINVAWKHWHPAPSQEATRLPVEKP